MYAIQDYEEGGDSLVNAIQDFDRTRAEEAEKKARAAEEKARREAEERYRKKTRKEEDDDWEDENPSKTA